MVKNKLKFFFLIFGLLMFIIGIRNWGNGDYFLFVILSIVLIGLGWKYPKKKG